MRQLKLSDCMHWSDAVRAGLLFCDICGKQIHDGCAWDGKRNICSSCFLSGKYEQFEHSKNRQSSNSIPVNQTVKVQNRPSKFKHLNQNLNFTGIVER